MVGSAPRAGWERRRQELRQQGRLYRLDLPVVSPTGLLAGLNENYAHDPAFAVDPIQVGDCEGLIIRGVTGLQAPDWCDAVTVLTGFSTDVSASSAGCALLLAVDGEAYAVVYGPLGHRLIDPARIEPGFGLSYAARMSARPMVDGTIHAALRCAGGTDLASFAEIIPMLTSKLAGQPVELAGARSAYLAGIDALVLPPVADPRTLLTDLRAVAQTCRAGAPYPELDFIRLLKPLPSDSNLLGPLDEQLEALLGGERPEAPSSWRHHLSLTSPSGGTDGVSGRFRLRLGDGTAEVVDQVRVSTLVARLRELPAGQRLAALAAGTIAPIGTDSARNDSARTDSDRNDSGRNDSGRYDATAIGGFGADRGDGCRGDHRRADRWITAEVALKEYRYLFFDGRWHQVSTGALTFLQQTVSATFSGALAAPDGLSTSAQLHLYRMAARGGQLATGAGPVWLPTAGRWDSGQPAGSGHRPAVA